MSSVKIFALVAMVGALLLSPCVAHTDPQPSIVETKPCQAHWTRGANRFSGNIERTEHFAFAAGDGLVVHLIPTNGTPGWKPSVSRLGRALTVVPKLQGGAPNDGNHTGDVLQFNFGAEAYDPSENPELIVPSGQPGRAATVEPEQASRGGGWAWFSAQADASGRYEFDACLTWQKGPFEPDISAYGNDLPTAFPAWVIAATELCGVADKWLLSDRMSRPQHPRFTWLEPDFDRDGRTDLVVMLEDAVGETAALGICLHDEAALSILGPPGNGEGVLSSDFLNEVDWWDSAGDSVVLGIEGASSVHVEQDENGRWLITQQGD